MASVSGTRSFAESASQLTKRSASAKRKRAEDIEDEIKEVADVWLSELSELASSRAQIGLSSAHYESDTFVDALQELYRTAGARKADALFATRLSQRLKARGFWGNVTTKVTYGRCEIEVDWAPEVTPQLARGEDEIRHRPRHSPWTIGCQRKKLLLSCSVCSGAPVACAALAPCGQVVCQGCADTFLEKNCPKCATKVFAIQPLYV